ncbi:death domain-containing protein 1 isoform X2 [Pangasianodon hypophthalmus]|uniref:death domain-containing protein 1 isoform X2 n=1 Tax=Pangasianodon hypophthalmus TaxID=310915 RepID=UPI002307BBBF|nr:death domain-containing protein 1 isoform X2 [Pangasianodon hypophthalmus]
MLGANLHFGSCPEDKILNSLQATIQRLQELLHSEQTSSTEAPGSEFTQASVHPLGQGDSARALKKVFHLFKEWSVLHTQRVGSLREAIRTAVHTLMERDRHANHEHMLPKRDTQAKQLGASREGNFHKQVYISDLIQSVLGDVHSIEKMLFSITSKFDRAITIISGAKLQSTEAETTRDEIMIHDLMIHSKDRLVLPQIFSKEQCGPQNTDPEYTSNVSPLSDIQKCVFQSIPNTQAETHAAFGRKTSPHELFNESPIDLIRPEEDSILCEVLKGPRNDGHGRLGEDVGEMKKEPVQEDERHKKAEKAGTVVMDERISCTHKCITVGLTDSARSSSKVLCYITAPLEVTKVITCKSVDGLSSLMVSGSEELVSSVLRLENLSNMKCPFPLTVAVPFQACYRLNYREAVVKVVDQEQRISYVTPLATEGIYGGRRGTFAVVRVYTLGVFAVLSRLQRETFTIPKRGLCLKLRVDSRICLDYPPGSFSTPVVAQAMVQPVDAMLLSSLKCRNDSCHSILTTSPLLYLNHPLTVSPLRPLTLTLPCPPKPKKTGEEKSCTYSDSTTLMPETISSHRVRVLSASVKASRKLTKEQLVVLGWKDEHWNVLDKVTVRNLQNDLVSFEVLQNYERLIVLRLLSSVKPSCLMLFAEELQESVRTCTVSIAIHKSQKDPSSVVLAILPSRDLSWGLAELHAQAYCGSPEQSAEILLREGEQLLLKFSGNITSTGDQCTEPHTLTFHNQRRNWLCLQLKELDPFGNYSSPYYKGTALLFQIPKDQLVWREDKAVISEDYCLGQPGCKLSLTLPKTVKTLSRPISAKFLQHDQTDPLCDELLAWLCCELSEEDASLLVMCLRLRRSSVQLARLRAPNSLALQIFHILTTWRQALPSLTPKCPLLAHCLIRIGRPELAAELLRKGPAVDRSERRCAETHITM